MTTSSPATGNAEFNPLIRPYLVLQGALFLAMTIFGLPLAVIWVLGVGQWWARHYFARLECHLDDRKLRYKKGILVTVEKTIPLENIQDVTFIEGPILRHFHLSTLKFETAGSGAGQAHDMRLTGIIDAHEFRNRILAARDALKRNPRETPVSLSGSDAQLVALQSIDRRLAEIAELMKQYRG